jgi:4-hydroxy-3-polyprenylbenzoate decarboxylase
MEPIADLRDWIERLRGAGELVEVEAAADPHLEITEIVQRTIRDAGPALLFRHPRGSRHPLLINQFGTERRMCLAFGTASLDDVAGRLDAVLRTPAPDSGPQAMRSLGRLRRLADSAPRLVDEAPCQEVVLEPDLDRLPIQTCWPGDPAPFITLPAVITHDPRTGTRNVGIYRMQKIDARTTFMHWQVHKDGAADWRGMGERLEVAVALGLDPITTYLAGAPLPKDVDELALAGFLRGAPLELVPARTIDLAVPARAEIVLEGHILKGELAVEGPFGDHTGYYSPAEPFPILHLTCMTMRRDAVYPSIVVGPPPAEDCWLGKASERISLPAVRAAVPEVVDYDLPVAGAFQSCAIVSMNKAYPGHARKVMHGLWGLGTFSLLKSIIVVDAFVDVHDYEAVAFHAFANVDPARDLLLAEGPLDQLDHAAVRPCYGGRLGIDATHKLPAEAGREWPQRIVMSSAVRDLVDRRWVEYGIAGGEHAAERSLLPF